MIVSNKIISILLYIVFGISILVIVFFYFGDSLIDEAAYNAKLSKLETTDQYAPEMIDWQQEQDTAVVDTMVSDTAAVKPTAVVPPKSRVKEVEEVKFSFFEKLIYAKTDIALGWAYILVGITLILALIFPLIYMFSSTRSMIQSLGILAVAAILVGIAYLLSSDTPLYIPGFEGTDNTNPSVLKFVDTAIFTVYFLIGLALITILYSEVAKIFKT